MPASAIARAILITWKRNGVYALRLVGDLEPNAFTAQPVPRHAMNHPAWVLSHLNVYAPICTAMIRGEVFEDPAQHPHGQKSEPLADASAYLPGPALMEQFRRLHDEAERALEHADDGIAARPNPLERWRTLHPTVGDMLVTLMVKHESGHLGQLSAWRRAMGFARVAV